MKLLIAIVLFALLAGGFINTSQAAGAETVELAITGGHETDPRDHGRPVILIGNALGVKPEVFREAFSPVKPAPAGSQPEPEQVQRNKAALLNALTRYGVTNDGLDRVSNYYRYQPGRGKLWPVTPARATATLKDGAVVSINITEAGAGYSSPPEISVPGRPEIALTAKLAFGRDLKTNGCIATITMN
jgi:hypothetical protein